MTGSGCWSVRGAGWSVIRLCATPCSGPTTCWMRTSGRCSTGARSSQAASTWRAHVRWPGPTTSSPPWTYLMPWCASPFWLPTDHRGEPGSRCWRPSGSSPKTSSWPAGRAELTRVCARALLRRHGNRCARPVGQLRGNARPTCGSPPNWPTCAPRFGGPPTSDDLDTAAAIAQYAFMGGLVEQYEPIAWAEELIEPAKAVEHPQARSALRGRPAIAAWVGPDRQRDQLQRSRSAPHRRRTASTGSRLATKRVIGSPYIPVGSARTLGRRGSPGQLEHTEDRPWTCSGVIGHGADVSRAHMMRRLP